MTTSPSPHDAADHDYAILNPHSDPPIPPSDLSLPLSAFGSEFTRRGGHSSALCLADVPKQDVDWLWPGRIPIGKVTLLVGDPGVGKSLVALDVAARLTRGAPWPDQCSRPTPCAETGHQDELPADANDDSPQANDPSFVIRHSEIRHSPASVLLLSAEDDLADTVRPRLEAAGADCSRIVALPCGAWIDFDRVLEGRPDCRLVIIDPLSAYLGRGVENFNSEVRRWIAPLAALAARRRLAVVAIHHLRKQQGAALHRTMGSLAFVAAARTTWLVAPDPADAHRRLLLPVKNNLAALGGPLPFTISTSGPDEQPVIKWSRDAPALTADQALRPPKQPKQPVGRPSFERDDAIRWLQQALAEGAQPAPQVERRAVAHGLQLITVRRAFRELGGEAVRIGFGPLGEWYWRLPGVGEQEPKPTLDHLWED